VALRRLLLSIQGKPRRTAAWALLPEEFNELLLSQTQRWWNIHITRQMPKKHFLGYAGRYIRRLPIAQKRILKVTDEEVVYQYLKTRAKILEQASCTPAEFIELISQHVLDQYRHSMRCFGLPIS
jgi:hypothetical protein